jgi:hypothetical protein
VSATLATQSRSASFVASLSVSAPDCTGTTSAPSSFMRNTFGAWRSTSIGAHVDDAGQAKARRTTVAVATPCWPAPVSAMIRYLPMRRASRIWPSALFDLVRAGVVQLVPLQVDRWPRPDASVSRCAK